MDPPNAIIVGELITSSVDRQNTCSHLLGAGAGGIATAARLAKAGYNVTVVEKNGFLGGRCSLIRHEEYVCYLFPPIASF